MTSPKRLPVQESISELKALHRSSVAHLKARVPMLLLIKKDLHHSKVALGQALGIHYTTIQGWKKAYETGGLTALLQYKRGGGRPAQVEEATSQAIRLKLSEPKGNLTSYIALQQWVKASLGKEINYQPLRNHVKSKYGTKLKVARKSHICKDEQAVADFKKS